MGNILRGHFRRKVRVEKYINVGSCRGSSIKCGAVLWGVGGGGVICSDGSGVGSSFSIMEALVWRQRCLQC